MRIARISVAAVIATTVLGCSSIGGLPSPVPVHPPGQTFGNTPAPATEVVVTAPYSPAEFWGYVVPGGDNVEHYDSLAAMTKKADAVVVGTVTAIGTDPERYKSLDLQGSLYATLTLNLETVLSGKVSPAAPGVLNLAMFMLDGSQYDRFAAGLPTERAIFFLRNGLAEANSLKQTPLPDDAIFYRVVSDQGLIRDVAGSAIPATPDGDFLVALTGQPFETVVAQVQAAATP